ncbi:SMP-30/gluconolactonase/LRE family protein [Leucothrix pacifica]|uniref:SMP-30/Gluconolactonase/LRE-like region domain-containing protein n=1 Tax=Leucothrix pacifica TaxID=1247513 RepID=A0A317CQG7_9GAMM|nr:SMP-30/gluconolactonase/LRE family protein [Leucothrix pacifica]PWR00448.1 hypothetical protein DKW60_01080 [Leucothrix pacifica]
MSQIAIDCVLDIKADIGESAVWCTETHSLFWVDIPKGTLNSFDPTTGHNQSWSMGESLGCFALTNRATIVLALASGSVYCLDVITDQDEPEDKEAAVNVRKIMSGFHIPNGMAFSPDGKTAYISDSFPEIRTIWAYDYDLTDGVWSNQRVFFDTKGRPGRPDGGTIDADGCYWMAGVSGWELVRITPAGKVDMVIEFPVEKPTKIAFGGDNLDTLFVTSLGCDITEGTHQPHAGGLFALTVPGVTGLATPRLPLGRT